MKLETSMGGGPRTFEPTLWTVVLKARGHSREALQTLLKLYWKPVYFAARRKGLSVEDAKDLCQGFFADLLARESLKDVARDKGRFRTFLLTALDHFLSHQREKERALKRGGGRIPLSLDFDRAETEYSREPAAKDDVEQLFMREWASAVITRSMERLSETLEPATYQALKPHLAGGPAYEKTARQLGITEIQLNNLIHRTRKRYREILRKEVAGSLADPAEVEEEIRNLFRFLKS